MKSPKNLNKIICEARIIQLISYFPMGLDCKSAKIFDNIELQIYYLIKKCK